MLHEIDPVAGPLVSNVHRANREEPGARERTSRADERMPVARIRSGDAAAFEQLFRDYYNPLCVFVSCYVRSDDLAEELAEAVFARIWEQRSYWEVRVSLKAYLSPPCGIRYSTIGATPQWRGACVSAPRLKV